MAQLRKPPRDDWNATRIDTCSCDSCYWMETEGDFELLKASDRNFKSVYASVMKRWTENCLTLGPKLKRTHRGNGAPKGMFAGTLTVSSHDPYNEEDMIQAIRKVFKGQKTCPVKKFSWYLEYTEANLPHIHFIYETPHGGRIPTKLFKRAWPIWDERVPLGAGHRGGYHKVVADEEGYLKYISKDKGRHETVWPMD